MRKSTLKWVLLLWPTWGIAKSHPFAIVPHNTFQPANPHTQLVYEGKDHALVVDTTARKASFDHLYAIQFDPHNSDIKALKGLGHTLLVEPQDFALMRLTPEEAEQVSGLLHHRGYGCGALTKLDGRPVTSSRQIRQEVEPLIAVTTKLPTVKNAQSTISEQHLAATVDRLVRMGTRFHRSETGQQVAPTLANWYQAMTRDRQDISIQTFDHEDETPQDSLVVRIEGKTKPEETIILGSHIDSISRDRDHAPGADDNASGTATNLEIFRVILEQGWTFDRTVEIHGYGAEEIGLVGSNDIARTYKENNRQVAAMVQFDMNLFVPRGEEPMIWFVSNQTNAPLNQALDALVKQYQNVATGHRTLWSGSSDHRSWTRQGYPAAFPFENPRNHNNHIHTARDTVETAGSFAQAAEFAKLGLAYVAHFAGLQQQ